MKKTILGIILLLVIVIAAGLYYVLTNLDAIVKTAIEKYGSQTTQTAVRVDKVAINLRDGAATINGLTIANPKGFDIPHAFSLGEISTRINIDSLTGDVIVIDKIIIRAPEVFYEMNSERNDNLTALNNNIATAVPASGTTSKEAKDDTAPLKLRIRHILFTDGTIQAKVVPLNNKEYQLKLPTIEMRNLGGRNGATPDQIAEQVINILLKRARQTVKKKLVDQQLERAKAKAEAKIEAKKEEVKQKAEDKLKDFLKR